MRNTLPLCLLAAALIVSACREGGTIRIHSLKFVGVKGVSESALREVLATQQSSKLPWGTKRYFDRQQFDADIARVRAFYADRGFPRARVAGFDVKLNARQDQVDVTVTIDEGQPLRIASVDFVGFDVIPPNHFALMKKRMPLSVGTPRDRQSVMATHEAAVNELRDHGYPYGAVTTEENPGPDADTVALVFVAVPGPLAHFGPIEISGERSVSEHVIRREFAYKPGDLFQRSRMQETQRRLYDMQLFRFANVEPLSADAQPTEVPTRATVAEGPDYRVKFALGYGTEEKARVEADYHRLNFLGGARTAGVRTRWSSLDRGVRLDATQPYFLRPHFSLALQGQQWYTYTPAYRSETTGATATMRHRSNPRNSWSLSLSTERARSSIANAVRSDLTLRNDLIALGFNPDTSEQVGTLTAFGFDLHRSTADDVLNARRGYALNAHAELAGGPLPGSFNYRALSADARKYLPIGSRLTLAARAQAGDIVPQGGNQANIPFSKKYFLGGATSVRGWGVYEVSPLSGSGLPIGGNSMLAANGEIRAGLTKKLGVVVFLDAGNVWERSGGFDFGDLRYATGPGLRYQTPIGPARLDFGYQLSRIPGLVVNGQPERRRWRIHFSIGQAF